MAASGSDFHLPSIIRQRQQRQPRGGGGGGDQRPSSAASSVSTASSVSSVRDFRQAVAGATAAASGGAAAAAATAATFRSRRGRVGGDRGAGHRLVHGEGATAMTGEFRRSESRSSSRESARSVHSHFSDYLGMPYGGKDPDGFVPRSKDEDCIKCMLRVPHDKCESHRYIRVGGGYRHSFWYIRVLLEEIELARHQALIRQRRLETIAEGNVRAVKTFIRTKSGRTVEKVIFMSDDDYQNFQQFIQQGGDPSSLVRKYLTKDDAQNLQSFDKDEQKAIKTMVRTKSGKMIEKIVYVSRDEYEKIQKGEIDAHAVLRRKMNLKEGEQLENWSAAKMRTITTKIRTKSGRIVEKKVQISDEDYQKIKDGKGDLSKVLGKYLSKDEGQLEGWSAPQKEAMKVIKTFVRTKSGKMVEKTILMTEEEYKEFEKSGGDPNVLKRFIKLKDGEKIDKWEKSSTVYADSDDDGPPKKPGDRTVDKHGKVFEYVKDPLTGKVYKKEVNKNDKQKGAFRTKDGKIITATDVKRRQDLKQGKRNADSESEFSYKSEVSVGGTRHVFRRAKKADGTYGDRESYHSSGDEAGQARRRHRRRDRKHGNDSAKSFYSDKSEGGTRRVFVREKRPDGTYGEAKEYHSDDSAEFQQAARVIKQQQKKAKEKQHGSDSEHSYTSQYSASGTRTRKRRQKIRDEFGNVIGYGKEVEYESPQGSGDSDGDAGAGGVVGGGRRRGGKRGGGKGGGGRDADDAVGGSDSDHSYASEVSANGTRHIVQRERIRDAEGNVVGYGKKEAYTGKQPVKGLTDDGGADKSRGRRKREQNPEEFEYYSDTSEGGTKRSMRRKVHKDEHGNVIGHGDEEVYDSDDADTFVTVSDGKGGKVRKLNMAKAANRDKVRKEEQKMTAAAAASGDSKKKRKGKTVRLANGVEIRVASDSEVFSDASTDSDVVRERMGNMTEVEKQQFLQDRAVRHQARENRRRDKYGDEYEKLAAKNERKKEERKQKLEELEQEAISAATGAGVAKKDNSPKKLPAKSMVVYEKSSSRFKDLPPDDRGIGLGHGDWGKPEKGRRKLKDGNEADSESGDEEPGTDRRKRDKPRPDSASSGESSAEIVRDKDGKVLKKVKKDKEGNVVEYEYDDKGNVVKKTVRQADEDPGDYFEKTSDGKLRLKRGKKRLDLDKISRDELRELGIDPNASKAEIMRQLRQKLGGDVDLHFKGKKIGAKAVEEYSDIDSDKLAEDDDLDTDTLSGIKRMRVIMKKGGSKLMSHMQRLIQNSHLTDNATEEEKASEIDFLSAYRLVDPVKLETYGKAFVVEDHDDMDGLINLRCAKRAIGMVPSVAGLSERQIDYALQVLGFDGNTQLTFRMFSVAMALCERVTKMDQFCRDLLEITNLIDVERKLALYKAMFYCNVPSDRDPNYIKLDSLRIELLAGGLNWKQQEFIIDKLQPNDMFEISFLDYLCYIPLFLSFHDNILNNPLDMSDLKYTPAYRRRASAQRDMNPLAFPLKKNTKFMRDNAVGTLLEGRQLDAVVKKENEKMLNAFDKKDGSLSYPASAKSPGPSKKAMAD